jgi:hypothetical protein
MTMPSERDSHWICEICDWQDDDYQLVYPDYPGGATELSLNDYRAKWLKEHHKE